MPILDVVLYPDPVLSAVAKPVKKVDDTIRAFVDDMVETMYEAPGIGLAAPQVGKSLRICICDINCGMEDLEPDLYVLINPEIVETDGVIKWNEGCLSLPGLYREVKHANTITVEALDRDGRLKRIEVDGLLAVCMQHEIDHLDGVMFTDRLSSLKKRFALKEWKRLRTQLEAPAGEKSDIAVHRM